MSFRLIKFCRNCHHRNNIFISEDIHRVYMTGGFNVSEFHHAMFCRLKNYTTLSFSYAYITYFLYLNIPIIAV